MRFACWVTLVGFLLLGCGRDCAGREQEKSAPVARLAGNGRPLLPVVVSAKASPRIRTAAATLADFLGRISGGKFVV